MPVSTRSEHSRDCIVVAGVGGTGVAKVLDKTEEDLSSLHLHDRHTELGLTDDDLVGMYRSILLARRLDQKIWGLNRMGKAAFVVSCQGHEGAQVGSAWAVRAGHDAVLPYYRDVGVVLTLGMTPYDVLLGVFARPEDPSSGGRQMPNHWGSRALNIITGSSPIATHIPHAAGMALASKMADDDARTYRTAQEVEAWRKKDPLQRMKQYVIEQRLLSEREEEELEAELKVEIDDAARRAEAATAATGAEAFTKVFARPLRPIPRVPAGFGDRPELRVVTGPPPSSGGELVEKNVIDTVRDTLHALMADDERVMVLGE